MMFASYPYHVQIWEPQFSTAPHVFTCFRFRQVAAGELGLRGCHSASQVCPGPLDPALAERDKNMGKWCLKLNKKHTMWGPRVMCTLVNKSPRNTRSLFVYQKPVREIGVICTNLAIERGPHIVGCFWVFY